MTRPVPVIDAVYTWVNGNDPVHHDKIMQYISDKLKSNKKATDARFNQINEIEYSIKSLYKYAPYIRKIFIVTDSQTPDFLKDTDIAKKNYPNVEIVDHHTIFKGYEEYLPTFNARTIESLLYKIPDLSEHFLYLNDDFLFLNTTKPTDFFRNGFPVLRGNWLIFDDKNQLKTVFKKLLHIANNPKKAAHKTAQQMAAKLVRFNYFYYKFHHTAHPLRKSTFENFFNLNPQILEENLKHKFRNVTQFTPQGLANHLEIKNQTYHIKIATRLTFFGSYHQPLWLIRGKLFMGKNICKNLFITFQNLSESPEKVQKHILNWLKKTIE